MIVTRFAPSPTGFLHIGHAYAALFAQRIAEQTGGRFLLRIEDIDRIRCREEFEHAIFEDLAWLGIRWEEPVRRQSRHFSEYARAIGRLEEQGLVYPCFCTRQEIAAEIARAAVAPNAGELREPPYPGTCRQLDARERTNRMAAGTPYALRLNCAKALTIVDAEKLGFVEKGRGPNGENGYLRTLPELLRDIVLARKDLPASYHVAAVHDDAVQGVTLVTRGEDLFPATHTQRLLQALWSLPAPDYAHHRLVVDSCGRKFAKRDQSVTHRSLRLSGATPDEVRGIAGI
jgi:glutamyl-Q tRNA(Asp) synthetase